VLTAAIYELKGAIAGASLSFPSVGVLKLGLYSVPGASAGTRMERFFLLIDLREAIEPV
jgi:hypothetical protein